MPDSTISPRGIPPIRTDWLADVAWRTAAIGPAALGALEDSITLRDQVDGEPWRINAFRISEEVASWIELDGDLFLPTDGETATMRVGIALVPSWDAANRRAGDGGAHRGRPARRRDVRSGELDAPDPRPRR